MTVKLPPTFSLDAARATLAADHMAREIGFRLEMATPQGAQASMTIHPKLIAPNGFLHAAVLTLFADITCGMGTLAALENPQSQFFTTLEIKTNHPGTAREGDLQCRATPRHIGRSTQVWDAEVIHVTSGKCLALFRCTQMVLPRPGAG
jgi:uncharacterized protein (TIGR00369 family)